MRSAAAPGEAISTRATREPEGAVVHTRSRRAMRDVLDLAAEADGERRPLVA